MPEHCVLCFFNDVIQQPVCRQGAIFTACTARSGTTRFTWRAEGAAVRGDASRRGRAAGGWHSGRTDCAGLPQIYRLRRRGRAQSGDCARASGDPGIGGARRRHVVSLPAACARSRANADGVAAIQQTLDERNITYVIGKTWTTDAIYRETPAKIARRRAEGCITVDMEAAAFFAVAQFRGVTFGQILYGGDDLSGEVWDQRDWFRQPSTREKLFWLAAEACLRL